MTRRSSSLSVVVLIAQRRSWAWALSVAPLIACAGAERSEAPTVSDSLGVTLIDYPTSFAATSSRTWSAEAEPLLSVGEAGVELYRVRSALYQSNGTIVVANGGTEELLYLDDTGRLIARAGGAGAGPGEFSQLTSISVGAHDSAFAYDARERRLSVFDRDGAYARSVTLQRSDTRGRPEYLGVMEDGEIVGAFRRMTRGTGLVRDSLLVVAFTPSGTPDVTLGVFPHYYVHWGPHQLPGAEEAVSFPVPVPLSGLTAVGVGGRTIVVAVPDPCTVVQLDRSGIQRVTRQRGKSAPVTEVDRDRLFRAAARGPIAPAELEALQNLEGPRTLPAFGFEALTAVVGQQAVVVTDEGGLWLHPFRLPDDTAALAWPRFDAEGFYEGTALMPPRFRPTAVRGNVVLGVYQDALDVEFVRAYRLIASP